MTRQEFSKRMADYRKENNIAVKDVCFKLKCLPGEVYDFEKGKHSYNLQKCLDYLDAVGLALTVKIGNKRIPKFKSYDEIVEFITNRRKARYTKRAFATSVGCSSQAITFFEKKECIAKIDTILKFGEALNFSLDVIPKNKSL